MKYYSINDKNKFYSFSTAVLKGLADDRGLFMPEDIPELSLEFITNLKSYSNVDISYKISEIFLDEFPKNVIENIVEKSLTFDAPLVSLSDKLYSLELFHGPTLAFKDFGAQFMAQVFSHLISKSDKDINILVATSGDTGSAVAAGFYGINGIKVYILYPKDKVSPLQEKQLTAFDKNIKSICIDGTFDDCQKIVKQAFVDKDITFVKTLSSANSINITRLIPQIFYYFFAIKQLPSEINYPIISVPSGNFGNLTAGLIAKKLGLKISKFIAATNINDIVPNYLRTGKFEPKPSVLTLSNAMDVGNPSNFSRILDLYGEDIDKITKDIEGISLNDEMTISAMRDIFNRFNYVPDPHGAVGFKGLEHNLEFIGNQAGIFLETAHPAKFKDIVDKYLNINIDIPERLKNMMENNFAPIHLTNDFNTFKDFLLSQ